MVMSARQDAVLAAQIRGELSDALELVGRFVRVSVAHKVAVLSGACPSEVAKRTAVVVATRVPGIIEVRDELVVEAAQASWSGSSGFRHDRMETVEANAVGIGKSALLDAESRPRISDGR